MSEQSVAKEETFEEAKSHSPEEKFFGVRTKVGRKKDESVETEELNVEVIDDRPEEDRRPPRNEKAEKEEDDNDDLENYSEKVQKRINKLKWQQEEERREKEAAIRMREEAIRLAQQTTEQNNKYKELLAQGENALLSQIKERASISIERAKADYKKAHDEGDTDKILESQEAMIKAQSELREVENKENQLKINTKKVDNVKTEQPAQPKPEIKPSERAVKWAEQNPWFGSQQHKAMTATAYGIHEELVRDKGINPESDQYYQEIDTAMRRRFPEYFDGGEDDKEMETSATPRNTPSVVAPSTRNNGAKPRKVQLTSTQVSLAKRLGITPEQYAKQLIKDI